MVCSISFCFYISAFCLVRGKFHELIPNKGNKNSCSEWRTWILYVNTWVVRIKQWNWSNFWPILKISGKKIRANNYRVCREMLYVCFPLIHFTRIMKWRFSLNEISKCRFQLKFWFHMVCANCIKARMLFLSLWNLVGTSCWMKHGIVALLQFV